MISDDCGLGGEISVFAQEAQRSLAEIISGLETQARSGRKDASAFKERARKLLDRNQESYKRKMEKYVDFQRETTKVSILYFARKSLSLSNFHCRFLYSSRKKYCKIKNAS